MLIRKKRRSRKKRLVVAGLFIVIAFAVTYWWVATDKFADTKDRDSAYTVDALSLIAEFTRSDSAANKKYYDKIVTVNGTVAEIEAADSANSNIKFKDLISGSYIIFQFQEQHHTEPTTVKVGDKISIKASFSGGNYSEILGVEKIEFKRAALNK